MNNPQSENIKTGLLKLSIDRSMLAFYKQLGIIEYTEKGKILFPEDVS